MSQWLGAQNYSHKAQLIGAAVIGGLTAATTIYSLKAIRRNVALEDLKASIPQLTDKHQTEQVRRCHYQNARHVLTQISSSMNMVVLLCSHFRTKKTSATLL
jgi:hypothetical protein